MQPSQNRITAHALVIGLQDDRLAIRWHLDGAVGREIANRKALEFFTGYLIEQALSVDNMFVFVMIFTCKTMKNRQTMY